MLSARCDFSCPAVVWNKLVRSMAVCSLHPYIPLVHCRANAQQPKLFVGMILILIFAEALALYGLIGALLQCEMDAHLGCAGSVPRACLTGFVAGCCHASLRTRPVLFGTCQLTRLLSKKCRIDRSGGLLQWASSWRARPAARSRAPGEGLSARGAGSWRGPRLTGPCACTARANAAATQQLAGSCRLVATGCQPGFLLHFPHLGAPIRGGLACGEKKWRCMGLGAALAGRRRARSAVSCLLQRCRLVHFPRGRAFHRGVNDLKGGILHRPLHGILISFEELSSL